MALSFGHRTAELGEASVSRSFSRFVWGNSMSSEKSVFVFVTADGTLRGLTKEYDGANLPHDGITWVTKDTIPMTLAALKTFVENPDVAMVNLIMRGYHIVRLSARVLPFPHRHSS